MDEDSLLRKLGAPSRDVADGLETQLQARNISQRLFDRDDVIKVDRFVIIEQLGMGAMGVVYRAYDPNLERTVALKLLHPDTSARSKEAATRMRREAHALARLSHPNVVTIFEVGGSGDQVWLAMELVDGGSLRDQLDARPVSERFDVAVDLMLQAGDGLSAAHDAGIVHRDFKPANVLLGADGRVRVADFGLARESEVSTQGRDDGGTETTRGAGTPAYMAPEQRRGHFDARADQYAYCVTFWEAVFGERPKQDALHRPTPSTASSLSTRLVPVLLRGLAERPDERFATMDALLDALRDVVFDAPARRRHQTLWSAGALGLASVAGLLSWALFRPAQDPCTGGARALDRYWSLQDRRATFASLRRDTSAYATESVPRLEATLQHYADDWLDAHRSTCLAHAHQELSDSLFDHRVACLERAGSALSALGEYAATADASLPGLLVAAVELPSTTACAHAQPQLDVPTPPEALEGEIAKTDDLLARSRTLLDAGATARALDTATQAVDNAESTAWEPLVARARHVRGRIITLSGPIEHYGYEQGLDDLRRATDLALRHRHYPLAIEAWARFIWLAGTSGATADLVPVDADFITALARGTEAGLVAEAILYNNLGSLSLGAGDRDGARRYLRDSVDLAGRVRSTSRELRNASVNLAMSTVDHAERDVLFRAAVDQGERLLGANHPNVLELGLIWGTSTATPETASSIFATLSSRYAINHPTLVKRGLEATFESGLFFLSRGHHERAKALFRTAEEQFEDLPASALYAYLDDRTEEARTDFEELAGLDTDSFWNRQDAALGELGLALLTGDMARVRAAASHYVELDYIPTAALARRLRLVTRSKHFDTATTGSHHLAALDSALQDWQAGHGSREEVNAALAHLADGSEKDAPKAERPLEQRATYGEQTAP